MLFTDHGSRFFPPLQVKQFFELDSQLPHKYEQITQLGTPLIL